MKSLAFLGLPASVATLRRSAAAPASAGRSTLPILGAVAAWGIGLVQSWRRQARDRRLLMDLDDHMLKDIGITREQWLHEITRPFWR